MKKKRTLALRKVTPLSLPRLFYNIKKTLNLSSLPVILFTYYLLSFTIAIRDFTGTDSEPPPENLWTVFHCPPYSCLQFFLCAFSFFNAQS